jgi:hypothetical protein
MKHFAREDLIHASNQPVPASGQLAIEKRLEEGGTRWTQTVSRWQPPGPLLDVSEIHRSVRMGFFEKVVLSFKRDSMERQNSLSLLQLLVELGITLFIASIVVPSLLQPGIVTYEALARGSLHTINIVGVTLLYTYKNVGFAILGVLVGAIGAFALAFPVTTPISTTSKATHATCG